MDVIELSEEDIGEIEDVVMNAFAVTNATLELMIRGEVATSEILLEIIKKNYNAAHLLKSKLRPVEEF